MRWGILGTGSISQQMAEDFALLETAEVAAVCSRSASAANSFGDGFGISARFTDFESMLASDIEAVYIGTPHVTHFEYARAALLAGKHVLCEKPLGLDAAQVRELAAIAEASDRFLMEAMWMKFNPLYATLRNLLDTGAIGEVRSVRASFGVPFPRDDSSRWKPGGSTLLDQGIYPVTLSHMILGDPSHVSATGIVRTDGVDLSEYFTLDYLDGRFAQGASSMVDFLDLTGSIAGTRGWIAIDPGFWAADGLTLHGFTQDGPTAERFETVREGHGYVPMLRAVTASIRNGNRQHPLHDLDQTARAFDILDEIRRQITEKRALADERPLPLNPQSL